MSPTYSPLQCQKSHRLRLLLGKSTCCGGVGGGGLSGRLRNFTFLFWEMEQMPPPLGVKALGTVPGIPGGKRDLFILNGGSTQ